MRDDKAVLSASRAPVFVLGEFMAPDVVAAGLEVPRVEAPARPAGGTLAPKPGPAPLPPLCASRIPLAPKNPLNAVISTTNRFMTPIPPCDLLVRPHALDDRTQIDSDAEGDRVEGVVNTAGVSHLQR